MTTDGTFGSPALVISKDNGNTTVASGQAALVGGSSCVSDDSDDTYASLFYLQAPFPDLKTLDGLQLTALVDIPAGTEITVRYYYVDPDPSAYWFCYMNTTPDATSGPPTEWGYLDQPAEGPPSVPTDAVFTTEIPISAGDSVYFTPYASTDNEKGIQHETRIVRVSSPLGVLVAGPVAVRTRFYRRR